MTYNVLRGVLTSKQPNKQNSIRNARCWICVYIKEKELLRLKLKTYFKQKTIKNLYADSF